MKNYIHFRNINVIVFDEAHWALKRDGSSQHPYRLIMTLFDVQHVNVPQEKRCRVIGASASLINFKTDMIEMSKSVREIERIYHATVCTEPVNIPVANTYIIQFSEKERPDLVDMSQIDPQLEQVQLSFQETMERGFKFVFHTITKQMAPWCSYTMLNMTSKHASSGKIGSIVQEINNNLQQQIVDNCIAPYGLGVDSKEFALFDLPDKQKQLLKVLIFLKKDLNGIVFVKVSFGIISS